MPIERYPQDDLQPASDDAVIWRFMPFNRFEDLNAHRDALLQPVRQVHG